jgi:hypothetical protein
MLFHQEGPDSVLSLYVNGVVWGLLLLCFLQDNLWLRVINSETRIDDSAKWKQSPDEMYRNILQVEVDILQK